MWTARASDAGCVESTTAERDTARDGGRRWLILPSETRSREFDAKLLLACIAAERGFSVIVGSKREIHLRLGRFPPAIYVAKDLRFRSKRILGILRRLGHAIVAWDEEALVVYSPEHYLASRVDQDCLAQADLLFAWGEANRAAWCALPVAREKPIHPTGNPRFDLLRPELAGLFAAEVAALAARFGRYVLVNSNFGKANAFLAKGGGGPGHGRDGGRTAYRQRLFAEFLSAARRLAEALPQVRIVVRPHPAESHSAWRAALAGRANAVVLHEGNVIPWILAADAMVHNGCTTAVEGAVLGRRPIAYRPLASRFDDIPLTNAVSRQVFSYDELERAVGDQLERGDRSGSEAMSEAMTLLERHVSGLRGPLASERIVEILVREALQPASDVPRCGRFRGQCDALAWRLRRRLSARLPGNRNHHSFLSHVFPPLEAVEVQSRIDRLRDLLGRFQGVRLRPVAKNVFGLVDTDAPAIDEPGCTDRSAICNEAP